MKKEVKSKIFNFVAMATILLLLFVVNGCASSKKGGSASSGVSVKELNPKTMQSKLCENLYFIGEVIDVDAYTGGYNLQIAFSTAYAAAQSVLEQ